MALFENENPITKLYYEPAGPQMIAINRNPVRRTAHSSVLFVILSTPLIRRITGSCIPILYGFYILKRLIELFPALFVVYRPIEQLECGEKLCEVEMLLGLNYIRLPQYQPIMQYSNPEPRECKSAEGQRSNVGTGELTEGSFPSRSGLSVLVTTDSKESVRIKRLLVANYL